VQVFEHDVYTVVLATDASLIPDALRLVPEHRRIPANRPLFDFYAQSYPEHAIALCCFDNRDAARSDPLLVWYVPRDPDRLELPAVDSHTGGIPQIGASAWTDHWVILGIDEPVPSSGAWKSAPMYWLDAELHSPAGAFLPRAIVGRPYSGMLPNGDFMIPYADLAAGRLEAMSRIGPDGESPPLPTPSPRTCRRPRLCRTWLRPRLCRTWLRPRRRRSRLRLRSRRGVAVVGGRSGADRRLRQWRT
jgi:hypothetical protein